MNEKETVRSLLRRLGEEHGLLEKFKVFSDHSDGRLAILINNVNILARSGLDTVLSNGDRIVIFPLTAGG